MTKYGVSIRLIKHGIEDAAVSEAMPPFMNLLRREFAVNFRTIIGKF
jgi:hypothetical protein